MDKYSYHLVSAVLILTLSGCTAISDGTKLVLGTSTKALEDARVDGASRTYACSFDECFNAVRSLSREVRAEENKNRLEKDLLSPGAFTIFRADYVKSLIVVMGVQGQIDTTEVGIFFSDSFDNSTRIEISSLSSRAVKVISKAVFEELDQMYTVVQ